MATPIPDDEKLERMKRKQLQSLCKKYNIKANQKSALLIEELRAHRSKLLRAALAETTNSTDDLVVAMNTQNPTFMFAQPQPIPAAELRRENADSQHEISAPSPEKPPVRDSTAADGIDIEVSQSQTTVSSSIVTDQVAEVPTTNDEVAATENACNDSPSLSSPMETDQTNPTIDTPPAELANEGSEPSAASTEVMTKPAPTVIPAPLSTAFTPSRINQPTALFKKRKSPDHVDADTAAVKRSKTNMGKSIDTTRLSRDWDKIHEREFAKGQSIVDVAEERKKWKAATTQEATKGKRTVFDIKESLKRKPTWEMKLSIPERKQADKENSKDKSNVTASTPRPVQQAKSRLFQATAASEAKRMDALARRAARSSATPVRPTALSKTLPVAPSAVPQ